MKSDINKFNKREVKGLLLKLIHDMSDSEKRKLLQDLIFLAEKHSTWIKVVWKMSSQKFDKRFGLIAIQKGFIAFEEAYEALVTQITEELEKAKRRPIGEILFEKGYMTTTQIDGVIKSMGL